MTKAKPLPPLSLLNELFAYDKETGLINWKISVGKRIKAGAIAGTVSYKGYIRIGLTIDGKCSNFAAHRIAWYIATETDPCDLQIDHIDGNRLNNSFANLRLASHAQNNWNRLLSPNSHSGFKGVSWHKRDKKWKASIAIHRRNIYLGTFDTPELAHMAYCKAAAELFGEFARGA
jgi:hypothetical protein